MKILKKLKAFRQLDEIVGWMEKRDVGCYGGSVEIGFYTGRGEWVIKVTNNFPKGDEIEKEEIEEWNCYLYEAIDKLYKKLST